MVNDITYRYLLDTNMVSHFIKGIGCVRQHVVSVPLSHLAISAITEAELRLGLAKKPNAKQLHLAVDEFLLRVDALPWDTLAAVSYGLLRATLQNEGKTLGNLDLLIAAHALSLGLTLVTNDRAFSQGCGLKTEDWSV